MRAGLDATSVPTPPFCARALLGHEGGGELLAFRTYDILRINSCDGPRWQAENLTAGGRGLILSEADQVAAIAAAIPDPTARPIRAFQPIAMRRPDANTLRPVVILGPCKDLVIDRLVLDYPDVFRTCVPHTTRPRRPDEADGLDYFFVSTDDFETGIARGEFVETLRFQNHFYGTSFTAVREAAKSGGYCVLDVSDPHTIVTLEAAGMSPIAIFLHPVSVTAIMEQMPQLTAETAELVLSKSQVLESEFRGLYSAVIENETFETSYYKAYHAVLAEARKPVWAPIQPDSEPAAPPAPLAVAVMKAVSSEAIDTNATTTEASPAEPRKLRRRSSSRKSFVGTETIRFDKGSSGLGFSFAGGVDTPSTAGDPAIYITKIAVGGAADLDGRLQVGDKLIEANDKSLASVTHSQAGEILRDCRAVKLRITRKCRRVKLLAESGVFGLGIKGGVDAGSPVVISRIADDSPASRHPRLELGHEITHVNSIAVRDLTHAQVLALIRNSTNELDLIVHPRRTRSVRMSTNGREDVDNTELVNNPFFSPALATSQPLRVTTSPSPKDSPSARARSPSFEGAFARSPSSERPHSPLRARSPSQKDSPVISRMSPSPDGTPASLRAASPPAGHARSPSPRMAGSPAGARARSPLRMGVQTPSPHDSPQDSPASPLRAASPLRPSESAVLPPPPPPPRASAPVVGAHDDSYNPFSALDDIAVRRPSVRLRSRS